MRKTLTIPALAILIFLSGCATQQQAPKAPTVQRPVITDPSEVHWRMYYEDQFSVYGQAPTPPADALDVAWKAYYAERDSYGIRSLHYQQGTQQALANQQGAQMPFIPCYIATAAYGTPWERHVVTLRCFRDRYLLTNVPGRRFVDFYYHTSPPVAKFIAGKPWARFITRLTLTPVVVVVGTILGDTTDAMLLTLALVMIGVVVFVIRSLSHTRLAPH